MVKQTVLRVHLENISKVLEMTKKATAEHARPIRAITLLEVRS